ncbi:MAG: terminase large subunit [Nanoarchaeota archaeon]
MRKKITKEVTLFKNQFKAFNFETQFGCAVAGVQSGKTYLGAHWAEYQIQKFPTKNGIIVAPTYKILQAATLNKFWEIAPYYRKYYKEQKGEIQLPKGGTVYIRSADNPLGIEGITAHWIWLDEGGMTSQLTWTVLRSRVSMTRGQILITTTPYNMGWLYKDFYLRFKEKMDSSLSFFTWKSVDNPYFSQEFYDAEKKRLPPEEFARRYEGEFRKMSGLVWDLPDEAIIEPIRPLEEFAKKAETRIIGVDWGFRNPAGIIVCYLRDKVWYVVDEWKQAEQLNSQIIQVLKNKVKEHAAMRIYADSAEPDRIQECKNAKLPMYEAIKDVLGGISSIRQLIYEKRFKVFNTCRELIDEMSMYHYPETKIGEEEKVPKEEPEKVNDHLCDSVRYAIYSHQPVDFSIKASPVIKPYYGDSEVPF